MECISYSHNINVGCKCVCISKFYSDSNHFTQHSLPFSFSYSFKPFNSLMCWISLCIVYNHCFRCHILQSLCYFAFQSLPLFPSLSLYFRLPDMCCTFMASQIKLLHWINSKNNISILMHARVCVFLDVCHFCANCSHMASELSFFIKCRWQISIAWFNFLSLNWLNLICVRDLTWYFLPVANHDS